MKPYVCSKCGAKGVKLWRQYQTFLEHIDLLCFACSLVDQAKHLDFPMRGDQVGWLVPAVPTDDGTFWGYTSVPQDRVEWWKALPARVLP